jgi:hypothetical protein
VKIKETYGDVEKGTQGYKVASIQSGVVFTREKLSMAKGKPQQTGMTA